MNKRTDRIRSLFAQQPVIPLSADNTTPESQRVASGSVKAVKDTLSNIERENETLRQKLAGQGAVIEVDTALIDPSPVTDRFAVENDAAFEALRQSIRSQGQEVPVLLRPHPHDAGRYQISYGHRRVRAARELGIPVKATVRELTDEQLVVAQGLENSAREDLSFIERALFAARIEASGFGRHVIQEALAIDRAEASKLIAVASAIPLRICEAIGKAPKIGRGRWLEFAEALRGAGAQDRVNAVIARSDFQPRTSDDRFSVLLVAALPERMNDSSVPILTPDGRVVATVKTSRRGMMLMLDSNVSEGFGSFLKEQLPLLFEDFQTRSAPKH